MSSKTRPAGTGFQPVNPWKSDGLGFHRRNLPHLEAPRATYFISFRCRPGTVLSPESRDIVLATITHWGGRRIDLDIAVVMPDHAHVVLRIIDGSGLSQILHSIKSYSAKHVKKLQAVAGAKTSRNGHLWLDESFDRILRSAAEWEGKIAYVLQNPVTAGLVADPWEYRWLYLGPGLRDHWRHPRAAQPPTKSPGGKGFQPVNSSEPGIAQAAGHRHDACATQSATKSPGGTGFQPVNSAKLAASRPGKLGGSGKIGRL